MNKKQIQVLFPDNIIIKIKKINFHDLARKSGYKLSVYYNNEKMPDFFKDQDHYLQWEKIATIVKGITGKQYLDGTIF